MSDFCQSTSADYFDSIAPKWDSWEDIGALNVKFDRYLERFGLCPDERILDVGCGTGNLTAALLRQLSQAGGIIAVDISGRMIEIAQTKVKDPRVRWICDAVEHLDASDGLFDRIICYSVWPHLTDPRRAAQKFLSMLKPGHTLHVWHLISREAVNKIHSEASEAVNDHLLAPAEQTGALLEECGFIIEETQDDEAGYLVTARKG